MLGRFTANTVVTASWVYICLQRHQAYDEYILIMYSFLHEKL